MSADALASTEPIGDAFSHEALLYAGLDEFVTLTASFLREGMASGEPALVVIDAHKIELLREALGTDGAGVCFADMAEVGANPARIIPAWRDFVNEQATSGRGFRGIGEPVWAERSADELTECQRHEALLNVAFSGGPAWRLLCPYDTETLDGAVLEEAERSHRFVATADAYRSSDRYGVDDGLEVFDGELPPPAGWAVELAFGHGPLRDVREFVFSRTHAMGLDGAQVSDLMVAVTELASNSVRHGGGEGTLRLWEEGEALVCEVRDRGRITDPLVGRVRPTVDSRNGRGLWLVHQLCDLVQIRSGPDGTAVRVHVRSPR